MARSLVSDELWGLIEPLFPKVQRRFRYPGRKRLDDRQTWCSGAEVAARRPPGGRVTLQGVVG